MIENMSIGIDIENVNRFEGKDRINDAKFLRRIFTDAELEYCFGNKNYAQHLCARYCAKEAVVKAFTDFNVTDVFYSDIEILNDDAGKPFVKMYKHNDFKIKISLSHTKLYAVANALIIR